MSRLRSRLHTAGEVCGDLARIGAAFALIAFGLFLLQLRQTTREVGDQVASSLQKVDQASQQATLTLRSLQTNVGDMKIMANATLYQFGDAAKVVTDAAREQRKYWDRSGQETVALLENTNQVMSRLDDQVTSLGNTTNLVLAQMPPTLESARALMSETQKTVSNLGEIAANPSIPQTLAHVERTTDHAEKTMAFVQDKVTKPASLAKTIAGKLVGWGIQLVSVFH